MEKGVAAAPADAAGRRLDEAAQSRRDAAIQNGERAAEVTTLPVLTIESYRIVRRGEAPKRAASGKPLKSAEPTRSRPREREPETLKTRLKAVPDSDTEGSPG